MCALPACFGEGREGGERERGSTAFACTLARFHPRRYSALPPLARSLACAPPPPSLPSPLPVCLPFSLRRPHLPPFLLCTCVSAPGVCGRSRVGRRPRVDVGAAITPVKVSERCFIFVQIVMRRKRLFLYQRNVWFNRDEIFKRLRHFLCGVEAACVVRLVVRRGYTV